ncbi:uncharacterized protein BDR25DRAFT_357790 [Lindgomyces ingoldianus]|uniref:Uncharacterized protein n=1 Tax=Lindgomyces ingoldianus TaxID=673940 RepID=A0ACB6QLZ2_9PLEO|nr:uncharacterized protein BDR25DRAFT_357790 [Lindgomyces ingoldianus]KAF2468029.1 hypothetical protein BDR25DRAFT_357790 [Lindgomyces ingoldianus]
MYPLSGTGRVLWQSLEDLMTATTNASMPHDEEADDPLQEASRTYLPLDGTWYSGYISQLTRHMGYLVNLLGVSIIARLEGFFPSPPLVSTLPNQVSPSIPQSPPLRQPPPVSTTPDQVPSPHPMTQSPLVSSLPNHGPPHPSPLPLSRPPRRPVYLYPSLQRHDELWARLKDLYSTNRDTPMRVFITEDLCPQPLEIVGQAFGSPNPEVFADRLRKHLRILGGHLGNMAWISQRTFTTQLRRAPKNPPTMVAPGLPTARTK